MGLDWFSKANQRYLTPDTSHCNMFSVSVHKMDILGHLVRKEKKKKKSGAFFSSYS